MGAAWPGQASRQAGLVGTHLGDNCFSWALLAGGLQVGRRAGWHHRWSAAAVDKQRASLCKTPQQEETAQPGKGHAGGRASWQHPPCSQVSLYLLHQRRHARHSGVPRSRGCLDQQHGGADIQGAGVHRAAGAAKHRRGLACSAEEVIVVRRVDAGLAARCIPAEETGQACPAGHLLPDHPNTNPTMPGAPPTAQTTIPLPTRQHVLIHRALSRHHQAIQGNRLPRGHKHLGAHCHLLHWDQLPAGRQLGCTPGQRARSARQVGGQAEDSN